MSSLPQLRICTLSGETLGFAPNLIATQRAMTAVKLLTDIRQKDPDLWKQICEFAKNSRREK